VHAILKDLMQFARPARPNLQAFSVRDLIAEVVQSAEPLAQQRRVQLLVTGPEHDEQVHADLKQASVALGGLLRNAIEAAPADGWAKLSVKKKRNALEFVVEDNGDGPSPASREHLFDPFYSGRSAGRGRGLGLPVSWRFARQMGGDVRFAGTDAGVTRFVLTLKLAGEPVSPSVNGYHTDAVLSR
jgi:signal transduction histidine kinase